MIMHVLQATLSRHDTVRTAMNTKKAIYLSKYQSGFSLIEILIALMILSVGLLGLAALQAAALKTNHGAYYRSQAVFLAYDICDRMRANKLQAAAGVYNRAIDDSAPAASADGDDIEDIDMDEWYNNYLTNLIPDSDASINCDTNALCSVSIQWNENRSDLGSSLTGNDKIQTFIFTTQL